MNENVDTLHVSRVGNVSVSQNTVNHYIRTLVCRGLSVRHCQFINCKYLSLI